VRTAARHLTAILLLAASGCASTIVLDQSWIEVRSKNFSIYTTLAERDARALLEDLELFRATLLVVTKLHATKPRVPNEIYAFQSTNDYAPFRPMRYAAGHFVPTLRSNLMAFATDLGIQGRAVLYHEYTHFLVHNEGRRPYPLWSDNDLGAFYAQAWLLVHYLVLGQAGNVAQHLDRYLERVGRGVAVEQAFHDAFGIDVDDLDDRLQEYARKIPSFGLPRRDLAQGLEISVRSVSLDEIATRLGWFAFIMGKVALAQGYFERASAANPNNARASAGLAEIYRVHERWGEAEAAYRRSLELAPDDWQNELEFAEYYAFRAQRDEADREANLAQSRERLARVIERAPEIPEGHAELGITYLIGDQPPEPGIEPLERAARLLPSHPWIEYPLAQLHYRAGHRARAIELLRRVVYQPHGDSNRDAVRLLEQLEHEANAPSDARN